MKINKLLVAGLLAVSAGIASAQTTVKLTGSTAFRKATIFGIVNSLNSPVGATADSTTDISGATRAIITGTLKSGPSAGQTVSYQIAFGGSVGGVQAVVQGLTAIPGTPWGATQTWLSTGQTQTALTISGNTITGAVTGAATFQGASAADVAHSDSFQASTPFTSPILSEENPAGSGVGVIDFYWVKGTRHASIPQASYDALTNITPLQAQLLLANGALPLSVFTGNLNDAGFDVLLVGRNDDSGTRLAAQAEGGYSLGGQRSESQYQPNTTSGAITGTNFVGNNGFPGGGAVAASLNRAVSGNDSNGVPYVFVGYVGRSDKNTAIGGATPGAVLRWSGQAVSASNDEIYNGAYTFWEYEHFYYRAGLSTVQKNAVDLYSNRVRTVDAPQSGIILTNMNVLRSQEGGLVSP